MRKYLTSPTMLHDKYADKVIQPDLELVKTLHKLLEMIPQDNIALSIDLVVADLIRFHNPPGSIAQASQMYPEIIEPHREPAERE